MKNKLTLLATLAASTVLMAACGGGGGGEGSNETGNPDPVNPVDPVEPVEPVEPEQNFTLINGLTDEFERNPDRVLRQAMLRLDVANGTATWLKDGSGNTVYSSAAVISQGGIRNPAASSVAVKNPVSLVQFNEFLYFPRYDKEYEHSLLWRVNKTAEAVSKPFGANFDVNTNAINLYPVADKTLYVRYRDGENGVRTSASNGNVLGENFKFGDKDANIRVLFENEMNFYFLLDSEDPELSDTLWVQGVAAGSQPKKIAISDADWNSPEHGSPHRLSNARIIAAGDKVFLYSNVFFAVLDENNNPKLLLQGNQERSVAATPVVVGDAVYFNFQKTEIEGMQIWKSDGQSVEKVTSIPNTTPIRNNWNNYNYPTKITDLTAFNDQLYFVVTENESVTVNTDMPSWRSRDLWSYSPDTKSVKKIPLDTYLLNSGGTIAQPTIYPADKGLIFLDVDSHLWSYEGSKAIKLSANNDDFRPASYSCELIFNGKNGDPDFHLSYDCTAPENVNLECNDSMIYENKLRPLACSRSVTLDPVNNKILITSQYIQDTVLSVTSTGGQTNRPDLLKRSYWLTDGTLEGTKQIVDANNKPFVVDMKIPVTN